jgi:hypothetical protein
MRRLSSTVLVALVAAKAGSAQPLSGIGPDLAITSLAAGTADDIPEADDAASIAAACRL